MDIGMLWRIDDPSLPIVESIRKAEGYFKTKYGSSANRCYAHPSLLDVLGNQVANLDYFTIADLHAGRATIFGMNLKPSRMVLPGHLWIGVESTPIPSPSPDAKSASGEGSKEHTEVMNASL